MSIRGTLQGDHQEHRRFVAASESELPAKKLHSMSTERIRPPHGISYLGLAELWRFRELFMFLTWRDVKIRYKQTVIGAAWAILQPLLMMMVFSVILGRLARLPTGDVPYPLFVFCGLLPWSFFASAITNSGNSVVGSEKLVTKVYFPRLIIPVAAIGSSLVDVLVASSVLIVLLMWYGCVISTSILLAPLCLALIAATALGIGTLLAAMNVTYRDFRIVLPFLIQIWMFATPSIFMDITKTPPQGGITGISTWLPWLLSLNPMVSLIDGFRNCILGQPIDWLRFGGTAVFSFVALLVGCLYFRWVEHKFADII
jgi:lipopolysaccharide transport system permease protein